MSKPSQFLDPANRRLVRRNATLHRSRAWKSPRTPDVGACNDCEEHCACLGMSPGLFPIEMHQYMYNLLDYSEFAPLVNDEASLLHTALVAQSWLRAPWTRIVLLTRSHGMYI